MPSVSQAQHAFMAMSASRAGRATLRASGKTPAPMKVGSEYTRADTGIASKLPKQAKKSPVKAKAPAAGIYSKIKLARVKSAPDTDNDNM